MCGIAGFIGFEKESDKKWNAYLESAIGKLNRRGPDCQQTAYPDEKVGLGHARLSIIDTTDAANQPMQAYSGRYTIVFNGEIYNYKELRRSLELEKGEVFETSSDTKVIKPHGSRS